MVKNKDKKSLDAEITNALLDDFDKFEHFAMTYWKQILWVAIGIVVAVTVVFSTLAWNRHKARAANNALANAKTEKEIIDTINKYPGYKAVNYARLRLVRIYTNQKKYQKAYDTMTRLLASDIPAAMRWRLRLDEAYFLENEKKYDKAIEKFIVIGRDSFLPQSFRCEANYGAGRLLAQTGKKDDAKKYLAKAKQTGGRKQSLDMAAMFWQRQAGFMFNMLKSDSLKTVTTAPKAKKKK